MSDGRECSSGSYSAEGQPLLAAAATVAVLSSSTAATAANLIQDTPPLTGRVREGEGERRTDSEEREGETGRVGGKKRMLLSGAEQTRIVQGRETGAALTKQRGSIYNVALSWEGWLALCS